MRRRIDKEAGPLTRMTPIPPRPGGVDKATIESTWKLIGNRRRENLRRTRGYLETDAQAASVTFTDGFGVEVGLFG